MAIAEDHAGQLAGTSNAATSAIPWECSPSPAAPSAIIAKKGHHYIKIEIAPSSRRIRLPQRSIKSAIRPLIAAITLRRFSQKYPPRRKDAHNARANADGDKQLSERNRPPPCAITPRCGFRFHLRYRPHTQQKSANQRRRAVLNKAVVNRQFWRSRAKVC
ncbi:hypothetical protein KCP78_24980 [Salmonella enterica subsp. enterica]|nr:hypothetical protein KCP78_24980 [Salmonella enterica subsp. enterica]